MASESPAAMTTRELKLALEAATEHSEWWKVLCREASTRAQWGSFPRSQVPASYDPAVLQLPNLDP
jgi:hypothetical protein